MVITLEMFAKCTGANIDRANVFYTLMIAAMDEYGIDTPIRQAAFLSQVGEESGGLHWMSEIWGPTPAQLHYEFDKDLGNTQAGDGERFKGRGLIETTGRYNYGVISKELGVDFITNPEKLALPEYAVKSACSFWRKHSLNALADKEDIHGITMKVNGGLNGYAKRVELFAIAKSVLVS